jgi:hypothetical protein
MRLRGQAALPYLPLDSASVLAEGWTTREGDALPERLVDWDPATDLHLFRDIELEGSSIKETCHLGDGSRLGVLPLARSDRTGLRIAGELTVLGTDAERERTTIGLHLRGEALGGTLTLTTSVVSLDANPDDPIAPNLPGSELWRDETRCDLEGAAPRFPISAVDFREVPTLDPEAAWTLDWRPSELDDPVLGAVRLLVNSGTPGVAAAIISGSTEPGAEILRAVIQHDVARSLILSALATAEFVEDPGHFPDGSIGRAIADLLAIHWAEDIPALAARAQQFPRRFEMELQARFPPLPDER